MSCKRVDRGFTLVELLVVMGVIAILISMLLPAVNRARESAVQLDCATQLRQIGQALVIYADNNGGMFPTFSGWQVAGGNGTGEDDPGLGWTEQLQPSFVPATSPIYNCKAFPQEIRWNYFLGVRWAYQRDQLQGWTGPNRPLKLSDIKLSSQFVLSGDCTQPEIYPPAFGIADKTLDDCDKDDATQEPILFNTMGGGRNMHRAGNNVLFGDIHVEPFRTFDPTAMTYSVDKMQDWNSVTGD